MKKVLVTGSNGFIGKNLVKTLKLKDYDVIGIDDEYFIYENIENSLSSILIDALNIILPSAVFHVGACANTLETDVNYMMLRNFESTKIISDWCKFNNVSFIYSSSAACYGATGKIPSNLYGWSKYVAEQYVIKNNGLSLRYFNVYGPGEEHKNNMASVAYQMYIKNKNGIKSKLFPNEPKRDFVYIDDVINANIFAYNNHDKFKGKYYDVGSGSAEPFEAVLKFMNIDYEYTTEKEIPEGYQFYSCSNKKRYMPGWTPKYDLKSGIETYKKYLENQ